MDFARKVLGKYGWKDGDGLGKNNNGIAKPLRATLKFDSAGFGSDQAASDFNNHWWERVFNDAANNVEVKQDGESIKMDLRSGEDGVEISTKGYSVKKLKKAKANRDTTSSISTNAYDNFMQAATLTNLGGEVENPDRIDAGDIEVTKVKILTDDELFKACGGRTAHKGARHGLKLSGKLARLEQQEQELIAKMMAKRNAIVEEKESTTNTEHNKVKKKNNDLTEGMPEKDLENKKRKKKCKNTTEECDNIPEESLTKDEKKKKSKYHAENYSIPEDQKNTELDDANKSQSNVKKEKKRKRKLEDAANYEASTNPDGDKSPKTKKKKKKEQIVDEITEESNIVEEIVHKKKKSRKKIQSDKE